VPTCEVRESFDSNLSNHKAPRMRGTPAFTSYLHRTALGSAHEEGILFNLKDYAKLLLWSSA
jgi:hypothetical protein